MKATYRNSLRSKELIKNAMIDLLNRKPFSDITVTDIVTTANINRGTFYNHYSNPIDVVEEFKRGLLEKFALEIKKTSNKKDVNSLIDLIVQHLKENEKDYKKIINSIPISIIDDMKKELIIRVRELNPNVSELGLYLIVNAISGLFIDYLKRKIIFSFDEMSKRLKEFVNTTIQII